MSDFKVKKNSKPELFIDGKKTAPVLYGLSDFPGAAANTAYAQKNIARFAKAGINLVEIDTELRIGWHKVNEFDPEAMIAEVESVLDANPNAKVHIRLHVNAPYWWMRDNPEELAVYRFPDGDRAGIDDGDRDRLIACDHENHIRVSLASEKWLKEAGEKLGLLCEAFKKHPAGDAVMSIQIACGLNGEWHRWGSGEDVSLPAVRAFHRFLYKKYGSDEGYAAAYGKAGLKIADAEYHPERFPAGDDGDFRDPCVSRILIDSAECAQDIAAEDILYFCRIVKEHLPNVLAGAFYGYYLQTKGDHLKVEKMFNAKGVVDFLCGPCCYIENRKAWGVPMQRGLLESCRLNGMLWLTEMDHHPEGSRVLGGGDPEKMDITIGVLRRNVLMPLLAGEGLWYYDHRVIPPNLTVEERKIPGATGSIYRKRGWWEEEELMSEIEALKRIADRITEEEYKPSADTLIVYDTDSYYYRAEYVDPAYKLHSAVHHSGAAIDTVYLSDLEKAELDRYKCVIIPNAYMLTGEKREKIRRLLSDKTKIWLGAIGFSDGEALSEKFLSESVGIEISRLNESGELSAKGEGLLSGLDCSFEMLNPYLYVSDEDCERLMSYPDGRCAVARKGNDIWLPGVPSEEIFARLIKESGAHIYVDSGADTVLAGAGIVAINSPTGGERTITLPSGKKIQITFPEYSTLAFDINSGKRLI